MSTKPRTIADHPRRSGAAAPARSRDHAGGRSACPRKDLRSAADRARHVEPKPARRRATHDDLATARITVSIEQTVPGSPLDERLRREQTRALLDLLVDVAARRKARRGADHPQPKSGPAVL
jgi:hypothetical protein